MNGDHRTTSSGGDPFEFAALQQARNYRKALLHQLEPYLRGRVLEVGAGIGQLTGSIKTLPGVAEVVSVEPEPGFHRIFRMAHPGQALIEGTVENVPRDGSWNSVLSVNVLEHIRDDQSELTAYRELLAPALGHLCLFVPARPELYSPIDRDFGHHRRYTHPELSSKLRQAGFEILRLRYFNFVGYLGWWLNFRLLKRRRFDPKAVFWFDRLIFPPAHWMEANLFPAPLGQSLLAVVRVR
jgi:SAM-dependent methyltransferase